MFTIDEKPYKKNALGHLVPVESIPARTNAEDELVNELFGQFHYLQSIMEATKFGAMSAISSFVNDVGEDLGAENAGDGDTFTTINSFDGKRKIKIAKGTRMYFGCDLAAAKKLIHDCIMDWGEGAKPQLLSLVQLAFPTDKEGDVNPAKLWELTSVLIDDDPRWNNAMKAIRQSMRYEFTKPYIRLHYRDPDNKWQLLTLDFAAISRGDGSGAMPVDLPGAVPIIRPIKSKFDHIEVVAEIERLTQLQPIPDSPDSDRLEVLFTLAESWEIKNIGPLEVVDNLDNTNPAIAEASQG